REDWKAAASAIQESAQDGVCLAVAPPVQAFLYEFFQPGLTSNAGDCSRLVLAVTPYATVEQQTAALSVLRQKGYRRVNEIPTGGSRLIQFRRTRARLKNERGDSLGNSEDRDSGLRSELRR